MQVIYHWAFAVAPALCPRAPPLSKVGARAPWIYGSGASVRISLFAVDVKVQDSLR